jgi:hypothetical protein
MPIPDKETRVKGFLDGAMVYLNSFANPQRKNFERREVYGFVQSLIGALSSVTTADQIDEITKRLHAGYFNLLPPVLRDQIEEMAMKCGACRSERLVNGVCPKCGADYPALTPEQKEAELEKLEQSLRERTRLYGPPENEVS